MSLTLDYIRKEKKKGYAPIILFVGRQRAGKTALAIRFAWELDPNWSLKYMTFKIEDFVDIYDKHKNKIIILDEASVSLDPYEHMTISQRVYRHIIDTQAYLGNIVFLVLPFAKGIGKMHRDHVNAMVYVKGRGYYVSKAVLSRHDDLTFKPPYTMILEECWGTPLPPKHLWETYLKEGQKIYKENILELQKNILMDKIYGSKNKVEPIGVF